MKNITIKTAIILVLLVVYSCGNKDKEASENSNQNSEITSSEIQISKAQFEENQMAIGEFEEKSFPTVVVATGMIDVPPENKAMVSATMGGYIKTTPLLIGDKVNKGQVLVTIENPEFVTMQQEYQEIKEQMAYLKAEYERQKTLFDENISSQKNYLKAESDYKSAVAKLNGLKKQLEMLHISPTNAANGNFTSIATIYAPISGSITKVNVNKGMYVSPATSILEIINNDHIHIELSVFEKDILNVKKDQKVNFRIPEASKETFLGEVHLVGTAIEENRTIKVHAHIEDESKYNFLTGMFVEAEIITDSYTSKAIPSEAIVTIGDVSYVLVLESFENDMYTLNEKEVKITSSYNGYSIITSASGFSGDEQILTKGSFGLIGE